MLGVDLFPLYGCQGRYKHDAADDVKHSGVMVLIAMVGLGKYVSKISDDEDDRHLALGEEEFLPGGPANEEILPGHALILLRYKTA